MRNNKALNLTDYALIGNAKSAALIGKNGSIEWCCLPEFHSPSIFASILDKEKGGFFSIAPAESYQSKQNYLADTNVLETTFTCAHGEARLIDAFTAATEDEKKYALYPQHEILRIIEGISGNVNIQCHYSPRSYYGKNMPRLEDRKKLGIHFSCQEHIFTLLSTTEPHQKKMLGDKHSSVLFEFPLKEGDRIIFSLCYSDICPVVLPELKTTGMKRMENTILYWRNWIGKCKYEGIYKEHVRRSALTLKLLTHAPSGAIIAAPTTSLPEEIGGVRNWDYRFCWLRDASLTVRVLIELGYEEESHAYMDWILHATQLTRPKLQVVYSVYGDSSLKEKILDWLDGYKNSKPVRIGNKADDQFQLDVYGEVLNAIYAYSPLVKSHDHDSKNFILGLGKVICELWDQPDNGIWEIRSHPVHHTHSKVMAWVGLDRLIKLSEKYHWKEAPIEKYIKIASEIHTIIELYGYNNELESYTRTLNGNTLDASLLNLSLTGYCKADSPRMISTIKSIDERLSKNNMLYRYLNDDDGIIGDEVSFGICNFWLAESLARAGDLKKAKEIFETMLECVSPAGLFSEEVDPDTHELLGNYPQGFTHIGLISAALALNELSKKENKAL